MFKDKISLRNPLLFSSVIATAFTGYYRRAYSATQCGGGTAPNYICSGQYSETIIHSSDDAILTTTNGFSSDVSSGEGVKVNSYGDVGFIDEHNSSISSDQEALEIINGYDAGSVNIETTGDLTSSNAAAIRVLSANEVFISSTGNNITSKKQGIYVYNYGRDQDDNTNITTNNVNIITANGGIRSNGIYAGSHGGAIKITDTGSDINATNHGIHGNSYSGDSTIYITTNSSNIESGGFGIFGQAYSSNKDVTITTTDSTINSQNHGIYVKGNYKEFTANITSTRDTIISKKDGIKSSDYVVNNNIIINGSNISAQEVGINIEDSSENNILNLNGAESPVTISGAEDAINLTSHDDELHISGDVTLNGDTVAGAGYDSFSLNNAALTLISDSTFVGFESATLNGNNTVNGNLDISGLTLHQSAGATLTVNGDITVGTLEVGDGAIIDGDTKVIGDVIIGDGGTISPDGNNREIAIYGDLSLSGGSITSIDIEIDTSDAIIVGGNMTIEEASIIQIRSTDDNSGSRDLITVSGGKISGNFGAESITNDNPDIISTLNTSSNSIAVLNLNKSILSPQLQSSINSSILFNDTLNDQLVDASLAKDRHFWVRNIQRNRNVASNTSNLGFEDNSSGIAIGAQTNIGDNHQIGASISKISNKIQFKDQLGSSSNRATFASIYGIYNRDLGQRVKFFSSLSLGIGYHYNENNRLVSNNGVESHSKSSSNNHEYNAGLQVGSKIKLKNNYFLMPRASVSYIHHFAQGFDENDGGIAKISVDKHNFASIKTRESVRLGKDSALKIQTLNRLNIAFSPYFEIGLSQEQAVGNRDISGKFSNGASFSSTLEKNNRNFTTVAIGLDAKITQNMSTFINYENSNSNDENRSEIRGGLKLKF